MAGPLPRHPIWLGSLVLVACPQSAATDVGEPTDTSSTAAATGASTSAPVSTSTSDASGDTADGDSGGAVPRTWCVTEHALQADPLMNMRLVDLDGVAPLELWAFEGQTHEAYRFFGHGQPHDVLFSVQREGSYLYWSIGDIDGDGQVDAVSHFDPQAWYPGDPIEGLSPASVPVEFEFQGAPVNLEIVWLRDIDGDGDGDIVSIDGYSDGVVALGDGQGSFTVSPTHDFSPIEFPVYTDTHPLPGRDEILLQLYCSECMPAIDDVVLVTATPQGLVELQRGHATYVKDVFGHRVQGDGQALDVMASVQAPVVDPEGIDLVWFHGTAGGTLETVLIEAGVSPSARPVDVDGDHIAELVIGPVGGPWELRHWDGEGFSAPEQIVDPPGRVRPEWGWADLDGDGWTEFLDKKYDMVEFGTAIDLRVWTLHPCDVTLGLAGVPGLTVEPRGR